MVIDFSSHSLLKIEILISHGINVSKETIEDVLRNPDRIDIGYKERLVAQKVFDDTHVIRVVYESTHERLFVVTVYPGRRSRYEENQV